MKRSNVILSSFLGALAIASGVTIAIRHKRAIRASGASSDSGSGESHGNDAASQPSPGEPPPDEPPPAEQNQAPETCAPSIVADTILTRCTSVVPSHIGSATWNKFAADYDVSQPGTSCGYLVAYALNGFLQTRRGTNQLRTAALKAGVWHPASSGGLPCPGDAYALGADNDSGIVHVGIVKSATDSEWVTLDSGQSKKPDQAALEVTRRYDPVNKTLSSLAEGGVKPLAGWASVRGLAEKNA